MKKLVVITLILITGIACMAQTKQDSLTTTYITGDVVEKLTTEELIMLIKDLEAMKYGPDYLAGQHQPTNFYEEFVSTDFVKSLMICIIISTLLFILLVISIPLFFNMKKTRSFHAMIKEFTIKGQEIPKELIISVSQKRSDFHKAIILISTGAAVSVALALLVQDGRIWAVGLIPAIIGIGYYIAYRLTN
ncbi:MAG: DUF6249 domain-containing protein [Bacteroidota bacterium]|nr:DUF6249 domain-containing protein [Bacteroidota bacterium]